MKYEDYTQSYFPEEEYFLHQLLNTDPETPHFFWGGWLVNYPEKISIVNKASQLIKSAYYRYQPIVQVIYRSLNIFRRGKQITIFNLKVHPL